MFPCYYGSSEIIFVRIFLVCSAPANLLYSKHRLGVKLKEWKGNVINSIL